MRPRVDRDVNATADPYVLELARSNEVADLSLGKIDPIRKLLRSFEALFRHGQRRSVRAFAL
jgi:hypothetical protein